MGYREISDRFWEHMAPLLEPFKRRKPCGNQGAGFPGHLKSLTESFTSQNGLPVGVFAALLRPEKCGSRTLPALGQRRYLRRDVSFGRGASRPRMDLAVYGRQLDAVLAGGRTQLRVVERVLGNPNPMYLPREKSHGSTPSGLCLGPQSANRGNRMEHIQIRRLPSEGMVNDLSATLDEIRDVVKSNDTQSSLKTRSPRWSRRRIPAHPCSGP